MRLTPCGIAAGCVAAARARAFAAKAAALAAGRALVARLGASPNALRRQGFAVNLDGAWRSVADLLRSPAITFPELATLWPELAALAPEIREQLEIDARYAGYLERQEADIRAFRRDEELQLPADLDYTRIGGFSTEIYQKLSTIRPRTLGQAARIPGVTPAALTALLRFVHRAEAGTSPRRARA